MHLASFTWTELAPFIVIGFVAQLVDSTFGMAFGVISNALLTLAGLPPFAALAATRVVEGFTSGASGIAHALRRNIDWPLFARLVIPGIVGGLLGIAALRIVSADLARPVVLVYLAAVGAYLVWRAPRRPQAYRRMRLVGVLGLAGGFLAPLGGWGPVVTGSLLAQGMTPRMAVGTVNAAKFFVMVTISTAFIGSQGLATFGVAVSGLLIGSIIAAFVGAWLAGKISPRLLIQLVGVLLVVLSFAGFVSLMLRSGHGIIHIPPAQR